MPDRLHGSDFIPPILMRLLLRALVHDSGSLDFSAAKRDLVTAVRLVSKNEDDDRQARRFVDIAEGEKQWNQDSLLHRLAVKHQPSKKMHNYIRHYALHLTPIREQVRNFVEIGVQRPNSLLMWEEFFPNATIHGIDIDPRCSEFSGGRRQVHIGDQKDTQFLRQFVEATGGGFDVVVDDGEHSERAILTSFAWLFPALSSHGIYCVEDLIQTPNARRLFRSLEEHINYWPLHYPGGDWPYLCEFDPGASWLDRNIVGLHFYRYLTVINRGFNPEDNPYLRKDRPAHWPGSHNPPRS